MTTTLCAIAIAVFLLQVNGEVEKRSIGTAREGQVAEKRYIAALAKNGEYPRPSWNKKYHSLEDMQFGQDSPEDSKRSLGALARTGDLRVVREQREDKRDEVDSLIRDIASADDLRRLRLEALRDELMKERDEEPEQEDEPDDDKRSMASVARSGGMPGKRSVEALARIGLLKPITTTHDFTEDINDYEKKISSDEFEDEKRGISSLARNGYYNNKRTVDEELEELMNEVYGIGEKRNVASLARGFNLPQNGKRSEEMEEKRNLPSIMRDRTGKRDGYTNNAIPFVNNDKRNVGALAKNKDFPYAYRFGKREVSEEDNDEMSKRYVATLLRDGRLPIGPDAAHDQEESKDNAAAEGKDSTSQIAGEKNESIRRKKDVSEVEKEENHTRSKRETFFAPIAAEVAPPTGDLHFGGMVAENRWADETSPLNKRYFAARGGGKMPGGRLPKVSSRSRGGRHNENSGRRRGVRGRGKMPGGRLPKVHSRSRGRHENSGRRRPGHL